MSQRVIKYLAIATLLAYASIIRGEDQLKLLSCTDEIAIGIGLRGDKYESVEPERIKRTITIDESKLTIEGFDSGPSGTTFPTECKRTYQSLGIYQKIQCGGIGGSVVLFDLSNYRYIYFKASHFGYTDFSVDTNAMYGGFCDEF